MAMELCSKVLGHAARVKFPNDQEPWSAASRLLRMAIMSMSMRMPARLKSLPGFHSPWPSASSESPCENSISRFFLSKWAKRSSFTLQSLDNISSISSSFAPALWFASSVSIFVDHILPLHPLNTNGLFWRVAALCLWQLALEIDVDMLMLKGNSNPKKLKPRMHGKGWRSGGLLLNLRDAMRPEASRSPRNFRKHSVAKLARLSPKPLLDALSQTEPTNSAWCKLLGKPVAFHALTEDAI